MARLIYYNLHVFDAKLFWIWGSNLRQDFFCSLYLHFWILQQNWILGLEPQIQNNFPSKTRKEQMNHPLHFGLIDKSCVVLKKYYLYCLPLQIFRPSVVYPSYHVEVITLSIKFSQQQLQQQYHFGLLQTHKNGSFWHSRPLGTGATTHQTFTRFPHEVVYGTSYIWA